MNTSINYDLLDKAQVEEAVIALDRFCKIFCRYREDYERFDDLRFRCSECPFQIGNGACVVKVFKNKFKPDYKDFGSMGDL